MRKGFIALILMLFCISSGAQSSNIFDAISPDLRLFLSTHPYAEVLLTNAISRASTNRSIELVYFHDDKLPKSFLKFPAPGSVRINLAGNQSSLDEFIGLLFETINSESEKLFRDIQQKAAQGILTTNTYATEMLKIEFASVKITRDLLGQIDFTPAEISHSRFFRAFRRCPENFDDFLADLQKRRSPERDPIADYEAEFARLPLKPN